MKSSYLLILMLASLSCMASEHATFTLSIDNDGMTGSDEDYSSGVFLSYTSNPITPYWLFEPLSLAFQNKASLDKFEVQIGQKIWTPKTLLSKKPQKNDRPYAGYLYGEVDYISLNPELAQRVNLTLGTTGKNAFAEEGQDSVHSIIGFTKPNGWDYQVENKLVGSLGYTGHFNWLREITDSDREYELSNISEVNAGNFRSDISTGVMFRYGHDLSNNFGSAGIGTENSFRAGMIGTSDSAWFTYIGLEVRYRFNDITIEGNRPKVPDDEYDVDLRPEQRTATLGATWYDQDLGASIFYSITSAEYKQAPESYYTTGGVSLFVFF